MELRRWLQPPRRLVVLFLVIAVGLVTATSVLAWRFLDQDRALARQRVQDRLARSADIITADLGRHLAEARDALAGLSALSPAEQAAAAAARAESLGTDALLLLLTPSRLDAFPPHRLLYYPLLPPPRAPPPGVFAAGEALEFRRLDLTGAAAAYRALAGSPDSVVRAAALLRLARVERKAGRSARALDTYARLADLGAVSVGGASAGLVARHARLALLVELGRDAPAREEAAALAADLRTGTWPLTRASYGFYAEELAAYAPPADSAGREDVERRETLADAVGELWTRWSRADEERRRDGSEVVTARGRTMLLLWRGSAGRGTAFVAGPAQVERDWLGTLAATLEREHVRFQLADAAGAGLVGAIPPGSLAQVTRAPAESRLPWTLRVANVSGGADLAEFAARRRLVALGLVALTLLAAIGLYAAVLGVSRELEAARLRSDFVAAVSHELRTPLTALRQFTELLASDRIRQDEQRRRYYAVMQRETDRLQRLVEGLLDFGRMEAGALEFHRVSVTVADLVRGLVQEFRQERADDGWTVELDDRLPERTRIVADGEAVGRALWNLLDNAAKYSPEHRTVWVELRREDGQVAIAVRDRGIGIAPAERVRVFDKFVRGAAADRVGAKGTGIGLAMVRHIVDGHGGSVTVESAPGEGSTFTLRLPAED